MRQRPESPIRDNQHQMRFKFSSSHLTEYQQLVHEIAEPQTISDMASLAMRLAKQPSNSNVYDYATDIGCLVPPFAVLIQHQSFHLLQKRLLLDVEMSPLLGI